MSATYQVHLCGGPARVHPAGRPEARRPGASRLELIAAWKQRHGKVDMYRLSGVPGSRAKALDA